MSHFSKALLISLSFSLASCTSCLIRCHTTTTDRDITTNIQVKLKANDGLHYQNIDVTTFDREVILRGALENPTQVCIAIAIAKTVPCIKDLQSRLTVKTDPNWPEPDSRIYPHYCYPYVKPFRKNWT